MKILSLVVIAFMLGAAFVYSRWFGIKAENITLNIPRTSAPIPFKDYLGINGFEWDFFDPNSADLSKQKVEVLKSFGSFRHYMDWDKLEYTEGHYTFNPTHGGGFFYDKIYESCKENGIEVLADLKTCPPWLQKTYPEAQRNIEDVPAPYGLDRSKPATYVKQAQMAFQFAARYGKNKKIDSALLSVDTSPRWRDDQINVVKIGMGLINYMECDNERDKWWKGPQAKQTPEEYAANMSAFYDGDQGKLGKNAGVKTADPAMKVVIGGLANPNVNFIRKMIDWCKIHRGIKKNGQIDLCFDIINYHFYSSNSPWNVDKRTVGAAPELSSSPKLADDFIAMSKKYAYGSEVWITEAGYDLNQKSNQRAIPIKNKSARITQADWMIRSAFLYARHGLQRAIFYMLDDVDTASTVAYSSSGFAENDKRRPVANYFFQTKNLIGNYHYLKTIDKDPIIDIYALGNKKMYVVYVPDQVGRTKQVDINLGTSASTAKIHVLSPESARMTTKIVKEKPGGMLTIRATETPVFIESNN